MTDTTPERMTADPLDAIRIDVDRDFARWGGPAETERRFKFLLALVDQQAEELARYRESGSKLLAEKAAEIGRLQRELAEVRERARVREAALLLGIETPDTPVNDNRLAQLRLTVKERAADDTDGSRIMRLELAADELLAMVTRQDGMLRRAWKDRNDWKMAARKAEASSQALERELAEAKARAETAIPQADVEMIAQVTTKAVYTERNRLVAALARLFPSGVARTSIPGWDITWEQCVYVDLPTGQASWHFHDSEAHLFEGLPIYTQPWDGHTTDEKYRRLAALSSAGLKVLPREPTDAMLDPLRDRWSKAYPIDALTYWAKMWDAAPPAGKD